MLISNCGGTPRLYSDLLQAFKEEMFAHSGHTAEETLISASAVPQHRSWLAKIAITRSVSAGLLSSK